ncbi:TolC family protein, partial [Psychrobacter sp. 16-Bac2893]
NQNITSKTVSSKHAASANKSSINEASVKSATIRGDSTGEVSGRQAALSTLIDPITHKSIENSYPLEVSSLLSLEQAQNILLQVSPKIAANQAAIAASEYQTDALKTIDHPLVFARVSATTYNLDADIDLSSLKNGIVNDINNGVGDIIPPIPDLPNFGELVGERIPDNYELKRSGSTAGAGLGVVWPIYTAGRTAALTGASNARTQEAVADSILDKNELYNTL